MATDLNIKPSVNSLVTAISAGALTFGTTYNLAAPSGVDYLEWLNIFIAVISAVSGALIQAHPAHPAPVKVEEDN